MQRVRQTVGTARSAGDGVVAVGSGPGEWLLLGPAGAGPTLVERWRAERDDGLVTVYEVWKRTGYAVGPDDTAPLDAQR